MGDIVGVTESGETIPARQCLATGWQPDTGFTIEPQSCTVQAPDYDESVVTRRLFHIKNAYFRRSRTHGGRSGTFAHEGVSFTLRANQSEPRPGEFSAELELAHKPGCRDFRIDDIAWLLSLAQRCNTLATCEERFVGSRLVFTECFDQSRVSDSIKPLVARDVEAACDFVRQTLPSYVAKRQAYDLPALVDYYVLAHSAEQMESRFVFGSIFMEAMKFNWAKNVSGLCQDINHNTGVIRGFRDMQSAPNLSFQVLMNRLASHLEYSATFSFIDNRNALFHSGRSVGDHTGHPASSVVLWSELERLYDQMDDMLLRVLGYAGPMFSPCEPNTPVLFPSRHPLDNQGGE